MKRRMYQRLQYTQETIVQCTGYAGTEVEFFVLFSGRCIGFGYRWNAHTVSSGRIRSSYFMLLKIAQQCQRKLFCQQSGNHRALVLLEKVWVLPRRVGAQNSCRQPSSKAIFLQNRSQPLYGPLVRISLENFDYKTNLQKRNIHAPGHILSRVPPASFFENLDHKNTCSFYFDLPHSYGKDIARETRLLVLAGTHSKEFSYKMK